MQGNKIANQDWGIYSGYYLDENKLKKSASGGGATALSEQIIKRGGIVFGVIYSDDFRRAEYAMASTMEELERFKGSKYIHAKPQILYQEKYRLVYEIVGEKLNEGFEVLFVGLGCDVGAVCKYLAVHSIDCSSLFTVDLICHGTPSDLVMHSYIDDLEKKYKSKLIDFTVRYKKIGWVPPYIRAEFENGKYYEILFAKSDYGHAFNIVSRVPCYSCQFKGENHQSDLTIGDYWGIDSTMENYHPDGVSLFIPHTQKGKELINCLDLSIFRISNADYQLAMENNPMYLRSKLKDEKRDTFEENIRIKGLRAAVIDYYGIYRYFINQLNLKSLIDSLWYKMKH